MRRATEEDLDAVERIQSESPEGAAWPVRQYLDYEFRVAVSSTGVAGFLVARRVAPGESEILNLAVQPEWRRKGVARALLGAWIEEAGGVIFLEVRESNSAALNFYYSLGFQYVATRPEYYLTPREAAIVLNFHSC